MYTFNLITSKRITISFFFHLCKKGKNIRGKNQISKYLYNSNRVKEIFLKSHELYLRPFIVKKGLEGHYAIRRRLLAQHMLSISQ